EARHMRYAREEFARDWATRGRLNKAYSKLVLGLVTYYSATRLINPKVYEQLGLDPKEASRAARKNPHWLETKTWAARKVVATLSTADAISGRSKQCRKKAGLLGWAPARTGPVTAAVVKRIAPRLAAVDLLPGGVCATPPGAITHPTHAPRV